MPTTAGRILRTGMRGPARTVLPRRTRPPPLPRHQLQETHLPAILIGPPCEGGRTPRPLPLVPPVRILRHRRPRSGALIPDRPHMAHGQQSPTDADFQPTELTGVPSGLEQMIAVSDATDRESHPFVYLWGDPTEATKMQEQMDRGRQRDRGHRTTGEGHP